jgi:hypothetical protein
MNDQEPKYFTKFKEELYVRLDGHAEQIAYLTEKTTVMEGDIKNIYKRLDNIDIRFDNMDKKFDLIGSQLTESLSIVNRKADSLYVDDINNRTKNLEKVVFA